MIIAGDCTATDSWEDWEKFTDWVNRQDYRWVVLVGGNHDGKLEKHFREYFYVLDGLTINNKYLENSSCELMDVKIWGSPWTPHFKGQNPKAMAFTDERDSMAQYWDDIPEELDILVTHGPPMACLDVTYGDCVGCGDLRDSILKKRPRVSVFGHIHEKGGKEDVVGDTRCYNVSCVDERYRLVRGATRIEI